MSRPWSTTSPGWARSRSGFRKVRLDLARAEPREIFRQLLGDELLHLLVELLAQLAEEPGRRDEVQAVIAVRGARLVEVLADPLGEELRLVLGRGGLLAVAARPAGGAH